MTSQQQSTEIGTRASGTRQALIDAALQVFLSHGFARATTREIARAAGVAEGTIYRHFADKYELFQEVFVYLAASVSEDLSRMPERAGLHTVRENLEYLFALVGQVQAQLSSLMASMWADPDLARHFDERLRARGPDGFVRPQPVVLVAEYLRREQALGRVRKDVEVLEAAATVVAVPFAAGMEAAVHERFAPRIEERPRDFPVPGAGALDVLARGLAP